MVQKRTLRKANVDACYVFNLWQLCKQWLVELRNCIDAHEDGTGDNKVVAFSLDDKANIPFGAPGQPRRPGVNGNRQILTVDQKAHQASDHDDHGRENIIPSVTLKIDIPDKVDGPWYARMSHVCFRMRAHVECVPFMFPGTEVMSS
jgi:hypothetical protein